MGSGLVASLGISAALVSGLMGGGEASQNNAPAAPELSGVHANTTSGESSTMSLGLSSGRNSSSLKFDQPNMTLNDSEAPVGIDISSHQHKTDIDYDSVASSQDFAFIKATQGTDYMNEHFRNDAVNFITKGTIVGFYHYAEPSSSTDDARQQASNFVKVTGINQGVRSLPPVLDIEESYGVGTDDLIAWTEAFVDEVKKQSGMDVMIYTYPSFWMNEMGNTTKFNHLPLWLASYNNSDRLTSVPGGWDRWTFWQHTSKGNINGISGLVDENIFNGTKKQLQELYKSSKDYKTSSSNSNNTVNPAVNNEQESIPSAQDMQGQGIVTTKENILDASGNEDRKSIVPEAPKLSKLD